MTSLRQNLLAALETVIDPELRVPIVQLGMVHDVSVDSGYASLTVKLTVVGCPASEQIRREVEQAALSVSGIEKVSIEMSVMNADERAALTDKLRAGRAVRINPFGEQTTTKIYLVGSGKGGVGKSTLTANLAVALAAKGYRVGLIDADIFGYSIPGQLGVNQPPTRIDDLILPPVAFGVKVISIGMFLEDRKPVAWRGPMLHRAINQFLTDVYWGDLDYLLVDQPPGTGDVAISLGQMLPSAKTIVVTTPQLASADVSERSGALGLQTGQGIIGVVENMAWLQLPDGSRLDLFGSGGGALVANRLTQLAGTEVALLAQVPISVGLREGSDTGLPIIISNPDDPASQAITQIANALEKDPRGLVKKKLGLSVSDRNTNLD